MERVVDKNVNTPEYWDKFSSDSYMNADEKRGGNNCKFTNVLAHTPENSNILDIGCLNGNFYNFLKKRNFKIRSFTGIDHSEELINKANNRFPEQRWLTANCYKIPFDNKLFDVITAMEILEHLDEPEKALQEMKRVTKDEGMVIITVPRENIIKDVSHVWSFTTMDIFKLLSKISNNVQIFTIGIPNRYIVGKAIINYKYLKYVEK